MRSIVIGAGVAGLTTALALAERDAKVTLIERSRELGGNASWLAGGMLAPFCEGESAPPSVVEQGQRAIDWWDARVPGVVRAGTLVVAPPRDVSEIERFAARTTAHECVDEARIAALEPDLAGRFRRGLFFAGEGHLDPRAAMRALIEALRRNGVEMRFGADGAPPLPHSPSIDGRLSAPFAGEGWGEGEGFLSSDAHSPSGRTGVLPDALRPPLLPQAGEGVVVDCRGYAARASLPQLRGVRGEMIRVRTREIAFTRTVRLLHPRMPLYVVPRADGEFMIGATMIESAEKGAVSVRSAIELLNAAYTLHPAFGEAEILEMSADVRPAYPDNEPRITEKDGRIYVNGFYRHGFLLSPTFAERAATLALERAAGEPHLGRWSVQNLWGPGEIELPSRDNDRPGPFAGLFENEADA
jgi:glycine oxidase